MVEINVSTQQTLHGHDCHSPTRSTVFVKRGKTLFRGAMEYPSPHLCTKILVTHFCLRMRRLIISPSNSGPMVFSGNSSPSYSSELCAWEARHCCLLFKDPQSKRWWTIPQLWVVNRQGRDEVTPTLAESQAAKK